MTTIVRWGTVASALFVAAAAVAAERTAAVPRDAVEGLLTRLDTISHDADMMTAKKAIVAAEAVEKFNQQYKGKPLTIRLKIQDVVPNAQGHCLTANRPDYDGIPSFTGKFQASLSNTEVMSITKESVLAVTGMVSAAHQSLGRSRSEILKQGSSVVFPLHSNPPSQICLDAISYQLEVTPKSRSSALPANASRTGESPSPVSERPSGDVTFAEKLKNEHLRSVDDIKAFFLKGIHTSHQDSSKTPATTATGHVVTTPSSRTNTRPAPAYGTPATSSDSTTKVKHNHIYTTVEIIQKFGSPSVRTSATTLEHWTFKCKDGVVHVHFTQAGYINSSSPTKSDTLKLEIKSVDSSSSPSTGSSRF
jgi:hypothetical protein